MGIGSNEAVERNEAQWLEAKLEEYRVIRNDPSIEDDDVGFQEWINEQVSETDR